MDLISYMWPKPLPTAMMSGRPRPRRSNCGPSVSPVGRRTPVPKKRTTSGSCPAREIQRASDGFPGESRKSCPRWLAAPPGPASYAPKITASAKRPSRKRLIPTPAGAGPSICEGV
jgi:hypothetical protein